MSVTRWISGVAVGVLAVVAMLNFRSAARSEGQPVSPQTRLFSAIANEPLAAVCRILDDYPALTNLITHDESVLHAAARNNRADVIQALLDRGAEIDIRAKWESTPLHWACWFGNREAAELLVEFGADVHDRQNDFGGSPLLWAARGSGEPPNPKGDYVGTIRMLLEHGASANAQSSRGISAVECASDEVAEVLVSHGARRPKVPATAGPVAAVTVGLRPLAMSLGH